MTDPAPGSLAFCLDLGPGPWQRAEKDGDVERAVARTLEVGCIADAAGIESLWPLEDPDGWDALAVLGALAMVTERVRLGTGVVNPYYRHPALMAASFATLDLLSGGRAFLGLGRGQTEWYGTALGMEVGNPVHKLEETIQLLRQWWRPPYRATAARGATEFPVREWKRVIGPEQKRVPIYLAAVGPRALGVAARQADGVIFNDLASLTFMQHAIDRVRKEAKAAGRDPAAIDFFARAAVTVTDDPEEIYEGRKGTVAMIHALPGMERLLETPGYDIARIIADVRQAMRTNEVLAVGGNFPDRRAAGDLDPAKRAIPDELMHELVVAGPAERVRSRLAEYAAIGVTHVFLASPGPEATAESLAETIAAVRP
jgi:5,10-methylenetetrahydromethanopterin reductase